MVLTKAQMYVKDKLHVKIYETCRDMGCAAAQDAAAKILELLKHKETIRIIFAAAPSQNVFLQQLAQNQEIDFTRITAFHMDEYLGLPQEAPQGFGNFLNKQLFSKVAFRAVHYLNGNATKVEEECARYAALLGQDEIDIVCMGVGENAHIAFNDPPNADFGDPCRVKVVRLEEACRRQQVNDGCFTRLEEVPTHALTLTIPELLQGSSIFCMVPGATKKDAVYGILANGISEAYPASILRCSANATLYLDEESSELLKDNLF